MFFFRHPTPFIRRPVAEQVIRSEAAAAPDNTVIVIEDNQRNKSSRGGIQPGTAAGQGVPDKAE
jgi:hypothetical protein